MEKNHLQKGNATVISIIALVVIIVIIVLVTRSPEPAPEFESEPTPVETEQQQGVEIETETEIDGTMSDQAMLRDEFSDDAEPGVYTDYSAEKVATHDGPTVIFFHASWCPTCRALDQSLNEDVANIPSSLQILKADYDSETELKQRYGVTTQHTLVLVDQEGNELGQYLGIANLDQLLGQIS